MAYCKKRDIAVDDEGDTRAKYCLDSNLSHIPDPNDEEDEPTCDTCYHCMVGETKSDCWFVPVTYQMMGTFVAAKSTYRTMEEAKEFVLNDERRARFFSEFPENARYMGESMEIDELRLDDFCQEDDD
jgi:hypothetical protein